ncbi:hypothetical protein TYRP_006197 [Tyrophagus putrescentiae]|nr:hypothetical protein TYRP_006197 [Tyrophagus putrescentiae]
MDIFRAWCHSNGRAPSSRSTPGRWTILVAMTPFCDVSRSPRRPLPPLGHDISLHLTYEVKDREGPLENREKTEKYFEIELHAKLGATMSSNALLIGKLKLIKSSEAVNAFYSAVNIISLPLPKPVNVEDDLVGHFGHLLSTGQRSDFTIEVGKSNHSRATKEVKEGKVFIADVSKEVMDRFLRFIYTGTVDNPEECYTLEMMALADKYDVSRLTALCASHLADTLCVDTVVETFCEADAPQPDSPQEPLCVFHEGALLRRAAFSGYQRLALSSEEADRKRKSKHGQYYL